jgi:hypothetical protein
MKSLLTALFVITMMFAQAQTSHDTITIDKKGTTFKVNDEVLARDELVYLLLDNNKAYKHFKKSQSNAFVANTFALVGGALIGWPIGNAVGGGSPKWEMAIAGAGFIALGIPFASLSKKHRFKAIQLYNDGIKLDEEKDITLKFGIYNDGLGVCLKF